MKTVELTAEELRLLEEFRLNEKSKLVSEALEAQKKEKKWATEEVENWKHGTTLRNMTYVHNQRKLDAMRIKLAKLLKKWDHKDFVKVKFGTRSWDLFKQRYGKNAEDKLKLIRKYYPDFEPPKNLTNETAEFHLDFSDNPHLMRYIRKVLEYNKDGIFNINVHEQYGRGYYGQLKALKLRTDRPFGDYEIMSAKSYIETINWWVEMKSDLMTEITDDKIKVKPEIKKLLATGTVQKIKWDRNLRGYKVTFNNGSWIVVKEQYSRKPDSTIYTGHVHDSQPPVKPKTYEEFKNIFLAQNLPIRK